MSDGRTDVHGGAFIHWRGGRLAHPGDSRGNFRARCIIVEVGKCNLRLVIVNFPAVLVERRKEVTAWERPV